MGGKRNKERGSEVERAITHKFTDAGVPSRRVVGSGAHGRQVATLEGDIQVGVYGHADIRECKEQMFIAEVKSRRNGEGFATLEQWLGDDDMLILQRLRKKPWVVMPWRTATQLLETYYQCHIPGALQPMLKDNEDE